MVYVGRQLKLAKSTSKSGVAILTWSILIFDDAVNVFHVSSVDCLLRDVRPHPTCRIRINYLWNVDGKVLELVRAFKSAINSCD